MKVLTTAGLTKLIQLIKSSFIKTTDTVTTQTVTLATVATTGDYDDLINKPTYTAGTGINISSGVISVTAPTLTNTATGTNSVAIIGTDHAKGYVASLGYNASAWERGTAIGANTSSSSYATTVGYNAIASAYSIQLGYGANYTQSTLSVGFYNGGNGNETNYQLLDGTTGLIPDARISSNIARASDITTAADGQWVNSGATLAQDEAYSSEEAKTYSLSSYLPNDGGAYEVLFAVAVMTASSSGAVADVGVETDVFNGIACRVCSEKAQAANVAYASGTIIMPVGVGRYVKIYQYNPSAMQVRFLRCIGYRRLGTNS